MKAGCEAAREFTLLWEAEGEGVGISAGIADFKAHLATCPECRRKYHPLVALMERDASIGAIPGTDEAFVAKVMRALPAQTSPVTVQSHRSFFPAIAAAAIIIVLGGIALSRAGFSSREGDTIAIHFTLEAPDASSVVLVGSFSDWSVDDRFKLRRMDGSDWELSVHLRRNELYSYGFLVDGERWLADPRAAETIDDGFGGSNSLLRL